MKKTKEYKKLLQRIEDIYMGATGGDHIIDYENDEPVYGYLDVSQIARIHSVVDDMFMQDNPSREFFKGFWSVYKYESPITLTDWLYDMGVRA